MFPLLHPVQNSAHLQGVQHVLRVSLGVLRSLGPCSDCAGQRIGAALILQILPGGHHKQDRGADP